MRVEFEEIYRPYEALGRKGNASVMSSKQRRDGAWSSFFAPPPRAVGRSAPISRSDGFAQPDPPSVFIGSCAAAAQEVSRASEWAMLGGGR
ncbi:hypothetical protein MRX96_016565 [Rhipicephalus microplus]